MTITLPEHYKNRLAVSEPLRPKCCNLHEAAGERASNILFIDGRL